MAIIEITLEQLVKDYDWAEVFADESSGNTDKETTAVPPGADVDTSPASRTDVAQILAAVNGENDGQDWVGLFLLKDGRYLVAEGGCDYTGWDCRAGNSMVIAKTLEDALLHGLSEGQRQRLGVTLTSL